MPRKRYYRDIGESFIPLYWLPGKFYQVMNSRHQIMRPWFFSWSPHTPCHFCDSGMLFFYQAKQIPKLWKWTYVELGADSDKYDLPLGLKFSRGRAFKLPIFAKKILVYMLKNFDDSNICTNQNEMDELVRNNIMFPYFDSPKEIMDSYSDKRSYAVIRMIDNEGTWVSNKNGG